MLQIKTHLYHRIPTATISQNLLVGQRKWLQILCKTKCIHFCQQRKLHLDPSLKLNNTKIPVVEVHKFLVTVFDKKLIYKLHINYPRVKCNKSIQPIGVIGNTNWRADWQ